MAFADSIFRITEYYSRHGLRATFRRAVLAVGRKLFANRMVVFYCDLSRLASPGAKIPSSLKVERFTSEAEVSLKDLEEITNLWNPKLARRNITERFNKGASLWIIKHENHLAGYCWTMRGATVTPYYFPLGQDDTQLFDFYVLLPYRGRAILWFLITHILYSLAAEGASRAFGDVAEWNQASLSFYKMTPFRPLGCVRTFKVFGRTFACWVENKTGEPT
jgi:hypothetical protein